MKQRMQALNRSRIFFQERWNFVKSKLLFRYAISYILAFLIPLTALTVFVYDSAVKNLRSEIEQSKVNQLSQVKLTIDDRMSELHALASRISYDEHLTPYMLNDPLSAQEAVRILANYKASNSIVEDLLLYTHGDEKIYSHRGLADLDVVFNKEYRFENWTAEQVRSNLNEIDQPLVRAAEMVNMYSRQEPLLTYIVPIKTNDPYPYGAVVYLMKESKLTGVMDSILNDVNGSNYIFNENGEVLTTNSRGEVTPNNEWNRLAQLQPGIHSMELNGEKQSVVSVKSEENNWTYVMTMPSHQFFGRVAHVQTLIAIVFALVVLTGSIAAMMLAKRQYHPVKDLMEFVGIQSGAAMKASNEWDSIRQTIRDYNARIDMQQPFVRNQCLLLLLKHGRPNDREMIKVIDGIGLGFSSGKGMYVTAILSWSDAGNSKAVEPQHYDMQERFECLDIEPSGAKVFGVEFSADDQLALVIALEEREDAEDLCARIQYTIEHVQQIAESLLPSSLNIAVGSAYADLDSLNQSFVEAAAALEYRKMNGRETITYFEQLSDAEQTDESSFWIPRKMMLKLDQSLKQGSTLVAMRMISDIMDTLKKEPLSAPLLRCICFDVLNSLLRTASEIGMKEVFADISVLASFETLEELESRLVSLASEICLQVERTTEEKRDTLIDDIVKDVDDRFSDYTLSLEHLALKYSVSTSYLSRSFKEKTGLNFSQYIWRRRVDEVIRQLETTSAPLKEIIEQVGYLDAPNFIRKFKKEMGFTPGQYRKLKASKRA
ncbi:helix-turn-helix domain-containing protein [Saccharibacillus sp. JS10]|uniref:helix-turn-helix domain-containing protein n=1 Tax=Saccharibacillus sp. JS10 TaxID=2950552 RepID=UPI00210B812A|nr:helix-turn-helix domain-containing protein [Saccharibacillus sp. JS10]MCQ4088892.1 helix-turn-helix domain-containing protein [Saccharibacillus sp. JS10]